ncbi:MAG: methyltransferase domain-containing protein [Burkholderiales bacterium]|nr:methyltransferase domain-containing protein [Burkholderiales bacterium]
MTAPVYAKSLLNDTDGLRRVDTQHPGEASTLLIDSASDLPHVDRAGVHASLAGVPASQPQADAAAASGETGRLLRRARAATPKVPGYLTEVYNWAYVHPRALHVFERQWLVNAILFGNYRWLRDQALAMLGSSLPGRSLQIACVYGDLTPSIVARVPAGSSLTVVDVLPQQLAGLRQKLSGVPGAEKVEMVLGDSSALPLAEQSFDRALLFFLLHEQPEDVRRGTLAQAIEVLKPGGRLVVVDYHRAHGWHPLHWPMKAVLATLEPYALDLWRNSIEHFMPEGAPIKLVSKRLHFAGLYQLLEFERI